MSLDINLYAEFLMHIRSATICATVRKDSAVYKEAYVLANKQSISLSYDGTLSTIVLPLGIEVKGSIGFPVSDPAEISLRLQIVEDEQPSHGLDMAVANDSPWSADQLPTQSEIACKSCSTVVIPARQRVWKDLPRSSWIEMLDQWYCHRPSKNHDVNPEHHGAAEPKLKSNVALVDICYFIIPSAECVNTQVSAVWLLNIQWKKKKHG